jgi:hypothetical protein
MTVEKDRLVMLMVIVSKLANIVLAEKYIGV